MNPHHQKVRHPCLVARLSAYSGELLAALVPRSPMATPLTIQRHHAPRQMGLEIDHGDYRDVILASPLTRRLALAGVTAEASLLAIRYDRQGAVVALSAADCFSVAVGGQTFLRGTGECHALFEWRR